MNHVVFLSGLWGSHPYDRNNNAIPAYSFNTEKLKYMWKYFIGKYTIQKDRKYSIFITINMNL